MPESVSFEFHWDVTEFSRKAKQAAAIAITRIADDGANVAKSFVRVDTSTLQKSVHSADLNYDGSDDFVRPLHGVAQISDLQEDNSIDTSSAEDGDFGCEFGSWVPYASDQDALTGWLQQAADSVLDNFAEYVKEEMGG